MINEWSIEDWQKHMFIEADHALPQIIPVDVRSPAEYEEARLPHAVSLPLFTDSERARIGTIYKKRGQEQAKWEAMHIVSPKIPRLLEALKKYTEQGQTPLIYCWRGGTRSGSVATFANLAGLEVLRLKGGFRAYREWCLAQLDKRLLMDKQPVVLHGMTGVGKSEILSRLAQEGYACLDLERLANHRGSVFGEIGIGQPHSQKMFDAHLAHALIDLAPASSIIIEAESKRIGRAVLPDVILNWKDHGIHIILEADLSLRVERIYRDYVEPYLGEAWFEAKVREAFKPIEKRFSYQQVLQLREALEQKQYQSFIQHLLEWYYDPRYSFHFNIEKYTGVFERLQFDKVDEAFAQIKHVLEKHGISTAFCHPI